MKRRLLSLAAALGILTAGLAYLAAIKVSCEECAEDCNNIPMDPQDCLQLYCPECAS